MAGVPERKANKPAATAFQNILRRHGRIHKHIKSGKNPRSTLIRKHNKTLNEFFEKRKQKIMIYVAYNKHLPQPVSNNENEFYNKILQTVKVREVGPSAG